MPPKTEGVALGSPGRRTEQWHTHWAVRAGGLYSDTNSWRPGHAARAVDTGAAGDRGEGRRVVKIVAAAVLADGKAARGWYGQLGSSAASPTG